MTSYLLLRNNKESGPHTFEELIALSLKPYDLVWASGKSAAWRYPGEIEELRPYAPEVVEQPFDRFFKRNTAVANESNAGTDTRSAEPVRRAAEVPVVQQQENVYQQPTIEPIPAIRPAAVAAEVKEPAPIVCQPEPVHAGVSHEEMKYAPKEFSDYEQQYVPRKSVYVTLPGQRAGAPEKKAIPPTPPVSRENNYPVERAATPATISITENPETAKIKYSQPLDDIKEMYVKTLQDRKSKIARQAFVKVNLKRVAIVAGLIGFGVLTGYIIRNGNSKADSKILAETVQSPAVALIQDQPADKPVEAPAEVISTVVPPATTPSKEALPLQSNQLPAPSMSQPELKAKNSSNTVARDTRIEPQQKQPQQPYTPTERNTATGERTRSVRTAIPEEEKSVVAAEEVKPVRKSTRNVLGNQVYVTTNDYKRVAFGGIRNLELTVTNNSKYDLDNVLVELQYLKPSEEAFRTESIRFKNIAPSEAATIRIPDTNRGIKVKYRIVSIGSKQLNDDVANN